MKYLFRFIIAVVGTPLMLVVFFMMWLMGDTELLEDTRSGFVSWLTFDLR